MDYALFFPFFLFYILLFLLVQVLNRKSEYHKQGVLGYGSLENGNEKWSDTGKACLISTYFY